MSFIHDDFLLQSETARRLYHEVAADLPIIDYHCHLPPEDVAADRQFKNLFEIWLEGDHYKWRAMRTNGVAETYCTGEADPWDKFMAWAETVPHTLRNPLYHWSHLELKRYFGIDILLNKDTAKEIWDEANKQLATPQRSARGILEDFKVEVVCTTDDPADSLEHHQTIAASDLSTKMRIHRSRNGDWTVPTTIGTKEAKRGQNSLTIPDFDAGVPRCSNLSR